MGLFDRVFRGSDEMYRRAESAVTAALEKFGEAAPIAMPNTAYYLATIYAYTGRKVTSIGGLRDALADIRAMMGRNYRTDDIFHSGIATAMAAEAIEACKYIDTAEPYGGRYHGHLNDSEVRELGVPLVTRDIPGFVVMIGPAPSDEIAAQTIRGYQSRGIFIFLIGGIIEQAERAGVNMGFPVRIVPVGPDIWAVGHIISFVMRAAMIFGNIQPDCYDDMNRYTFERIFAFVNAYSPVDDMTVACGAGAIAMGFPVITNDTDDMWAVPKSLIINENVEEWIATSLEARDIKIKVTDIDIPVAFSSAFEGEIIRRGDMRVEMDGSRTDCLELVRARPVHEIEDHKITVSGNDFDSVEQGGRVTVAILAEVAGRDMQSDFEPVFERKLHDYINCVEGVMHTGQRDLIRIRVSNTAFDAGFRARHIGEVVYAKLKNDFANVIDKCQITIITEPEAVHKLRAEANDIYNARDERLENLTDESAEMFYTCTLCQSFSPAHVCIVTPERLGLCGAVSWLDAKATNELDPSGHCQIVPKKKVIDERIGSWEEVNDAVYQYSRGALERVTLYSILEDPMTSCGCFECICGIEPMSNGVVIVNREHTGMTPVGMTFSELASMTGGGVQTPGFMGHGKHFIASKKFMKAEGGIARIVWMPKALKEIVAERLNRTAKALYGIDNFCERVCDETVAEDPEALMEFLSDKAHPVLEMELLM